MNLLIKMHNHLTMGFDIVQDAHKQIRNENLNFKFKFMWFIQSSLNIKDC